MNWQHYLHITIEIARAAGDILRQGYGQSKQIVHKSTAVDWVTQFDTQVEALILTQLSTSFPHHCVVAEESGRGNQASPFVWYIDPLDGTTNFAHGFPIFAVSMALYEQDQPRLGVVYDPLRDECFTAVSGAGAFLLHGEQRRPLRVSQATTLVESLLGTGFPYDRHTSPADNMEQATAFLKRAQGLRRGGAAALDMAYVAAGRLDGYWEFKLSSWDIAAGVLLVQEAGGRVTQMNGDPFVISPRPALIASNGRIHDTMRDVLATTQITPAHYLKT